MGKMIKVGPVGCISGVEWDESECGDIVQIFISHGNGISSVQFQHIDNGTLLLSEIHGESDGRMFDVVKLDYPSEFITCVSGHYVSNGLTSLTFTTNKGTYGPFGSYKNSDTEFKLQKGQNNRFGGFHGTVSNSSMYPRVTSIGVYIKPLTDLVFLRSPPPIQSRPTAGGVYAEPSSDSAWCGPH